MLLWRKGSGGEYVQFGVEEGTFQNYSFLSRPCSLYIQPPFPCHISHFQVTSLYHSTFDKLKSRYLENYWRSIKQYYYSNKLV